MDFLFPRIPKWHRWCSKCLNCAWPNSHYYLSHKDYLLFHYNASLGEHQGRLMVLSAGFTWKVHKSCFLYNSNLVTKGHNCIFFPYRKRIICWLFGESHALHCKIQFLAPLILLCRREYCNNSLMSSAFFSGRLDLPPRMCLCKLVMMVLNNLCSVLMIEEKGYHCF